MTLANHSRVNDRLATPSSVPRMIVWPPTLTAEAITGKFCRRFGPASASPGSLGVTPSSPRSMPRPPLSWIGFAEMRLPRPSCDGHTRPAIECYGVGRTRDRAADRVVCDPSEAMPFIALPSLADAGGIRADEVALHEVHRARDALDDDAVAGVAGDDVPAPAAVPPIVFVRTRVRRSTPILLPSAAVPAASVPIRFPCTRLPVESRSWIRIPVAGVGGDDVSLHRPPFRRSCCSGAHVEDDCPSPRYPVRDRTASKSRADDSYPMHQVARGQRRR